MRHQGSRMSSRSLRGPGTWSILVAQNKTLLCAFGLCTSEPGDLNPNPEGPR